MPNTSPDDLRQQIADAEDARDWPKAAALKAQFGKPATPDLESMTTEQLRERAAKLAEKAELQRQIAELESERKFASAAALKTKLLQLFPVDHNGHPIN